MHERAFMSSDFEEYCKEKGIQQVLITTGVPRSNGQVERVNAIISAVFTKVAAQEPLKWYQHVTRVQKALNSTYQRSIEMSPFELLFGAKMREYGDLELKQFIEDEWRNLFIEQRDELRVKAKEQIQKTQEENRRGFNKKRTEALKYSKGELVAIKRTQFGTGLKFKRKYLGPYQVVKVKRNDRYQVSKVGVSEGPNETSSSADYMKQWRGTSRDALDFEEYEDTDDEEEAEFSDENSSKE